MTQKEKKKIAELERDLKKMQKEHEEIFAEFEPKEKQPPKKLLDRIIEKINPKSQ